MNVGERSKFVLGRIENIVGKGENAGFQHFLLFPRCFQKVSLSRSLKLGLCGKDLSQKKSHQVDSTDKPVLEVTCIKRPPALTLS